MEDNSPIREIGGSKFSLWLGNYFGRLSKKYLDKGTKNILSNPSSKFINPFTLIITFTMNNVDKYQLTLVNNYKDKFKEFKAKEALALEGLIKAEIIKYREIKKNNGDEDSETITDEEILESITIPEKPNINALENKEMFLIILTNKGEWFLKK